jgi:hypothetical protein
LEQIIDELKNNHIIHSNDVKVLKEYISQKYPYDSLNRTAVIFADAVHKIIDHNIIHFDEPSRISIKRNLLKEVSQKKVFEINAFEVFEVCTQLYVADEDYIERLTSWINHNQSKIISVDEVVKLSTDLNKPIKPVLNEATLVLRARLAVLDEETKRQQEQQQAMIDASILAEQIIEQEIAIEEPLQFQVKISLLSRLKSNYKEAIAIAALTTVIFSLIGSLKYFDHVNKKPIPNHSIINMPTIVNELNEKVFSKASLGNHLPEHLQYKVINLEALKAWLKEKDSTLADETYFNSIHMTAKAYDINPLLMFAIAGQEQAFVPKTSDDADAMANNPFNVFGSWETYNTDIDDASSIAAQTILNLSKDCPENEDPIKWINKKYAEDQNWHIGVTKIYTQLVKATNLN